MRVSLLFVVLAATLTASSIDGPVTQSGTTAPPKANAGQKPPESRPSEKRLRAFSSEQELSAFLRVIAEEQARRMRARRALPSVPMAAEMAAPAPAVAGAKTALADAGNSITNVQHAGVDEGGIVKRHVDHLVILRRGRLFTVALGDDDLRPVSAIEAFAPDIDPHGTWYDEMLISGDTVIVIGYSYQRGGTEVGLFDISAAGQLRYRSTYHLRSNDYYSSRNYSSRLIGSKLVFYTPLPLRPTTEAPLDTLPSFRKWRTGASNGEFRRITSASQVYRPWSSFGDRDYFVLHTVTVCDLARQDMDCKATTVMGPAGRVFYVSPQSVYIWTTGSISTQGQQRSMLYQMPLDGGAPSAIQVTGSPIDQFSFLESDDDHINVLVRSGGAGDGMWNAEYGAGSLRLLRLWRGSLSDGSESAPESSYRRLSGPRGYALQNRFIGKYLLYGMGAGWGRSESPEARLYAVRWDGGPAFSLPLPHGVDRIEALGSDAVAIGTDGEDLHFSSVRLSGEVAVAGRYTRTGASQGELRSHGFFYTRESANTGMLGLPIARSGRPGYQHLRENSAAILFLRNRSLRFTELGELESHQSGRTDDGCRASCVDWYGNARPLFIGRRVFALLGYEIVEGKLTDEGIIEGRRINYANARHMTTSNRP